MHQPEKMPRVSGDGVALPLDESLRKLATPNTTAATAPSATPAAATTSTGVSSVGSAALSASGVGTTAVTNGTSAALGLLPGNAAGQPGTTAPAASTNNCSRGALATQGLGTFHGLDYMMVVYGCYRTGTRVLCDFDLLKANATQVGVGLVCQRGDGE